ncbi:MAG: polyribonucleotide nucleotidyltransferase [Candidatus Omnitrophica bacterium]|nr:polyribonucleotide nucleotidyltransferase [Candidatus Omnitrophota bacterium]
MNKIEIPFGNKNIIIETGKLAKQANGAVTVTCGGTVVLVAVCMTKKPKEDADFFPLMVDYQEKTYAAGKIPGGFFKREGRPTQKEILTSRLIDRPVRPLFPKGFLNDVLVTAVVLSSDNENDPDVLAILGASAALHISDIPFEGPIGAARVVFLDGKYILNPNYEEREKSALELVVVGLKEGVVMIEGEALEVPESEVVNGLNFAQKELQPLIDAQETFKKQCGKAKVSVDLIQAHPDLKKKVEALCLAKLTKIYQIADKMERENAQGVLFDELVSDMAIFESYKVGEREVTKGQLKEILDQIEYDVVRKMIFEKQLRADGRGLKDVRNISCEVNILPRTHGSSLFTRGQTQSLAVVTLGTKRDEQMVESLTGVSYNNFMLHYNFPSFSVGEAKVSRGPGRREIGHGALAAKALKGVLPTKDDFPYTIRVVSEILESNGSSSMASVCAGCLSLMAAGVPIKSPVAGISIGLILDDNGKYALLTDIMGLEDHFGDMDYKIAGSKKGVTAIQLDLKVKGVPLDVLAKGIEQAKEARTMILDKMTAVIDKPKTDISEYAPRILIITIPQEKIGEVIGPGGKTIKKIMETTGAEAIDIDDDGKVFISAMDKGAAEKALEYVKGLVEVPEVGRIYDALVTRVENYGAFCEILPGRQGLVHISEAAKSYVKDINTVIKVGDRVKVKLLEIDQMNRLNLSIKQAITE